MGLIVPQPVRDGSCPREAKQLGQSPVAGRKQQISGGSGPHAPCSAPSEQHRQIISTATSRKTALAQSLANTLRKALLFPSHPLLPPGQLRWKIPSSLLRGTERGFDSSCKKMF